MSYNDGTFTSPVINGPKSISFPLLNGAAPDKYARVVTRNYVVGIDAYTPTAGDRTSYTNLLTYSADLSNAAWTKSDSTALANILANPWDGTVTASLMLETATTAPHAVSQAYTFTAAQHTFMAIVRGGRNWVMLRAAVGASAWDCFFNVNTGTVGTESGATGSIVDLGGGWRLCIIVFTPTAGAGSVQILASPDGSTLTYAGNTETGLFVANAQLALAGADGPLIITTSTTRTVSAPPTDRSQNSTADADADPFAYLVAESELSPFAGNWTFSRTYARIPAPRTDYSNRILVRPAVDDLYLNVSGANYWAATVDNGQTFHVFTTRTTATVTDLGSGTINFAATGHGASVGDSWVAWSGNKIAGRGVVTQVIDANNFYALGAALTDSTVGGVTAVTLAKNGTRYVVEPPVSVSVFEASAFYLPGVSANVTTPADIPLSSPQVDAISWLNAVATNANFAVADGTAVEAWNGWPIYRAKTDSVEMSDAKVTVSASA